MSHALVPDFSVPLGLPPLRFDGDRLPFLADPILDAIEAHEEAWLAFQVAPEGEASIRADDETSDSLDALLVTACLTRFGAFALLRHLRWWLNEEAENAGLIDLPYRIAQAREAELTLLLGCDGIDRIPVALPLGRLTGTPSVPVSSLPPIAAMPAPSPALIRRSGRDLAVAGEVLAAFVVIGLGSVLTGLATLL